MSKFSDYESSHITPQYTLLEKFNEVLKFLRDFEPDRQIYSHQMHLTFENGDWLEFYLISTKKDKYEITDFDNTEDVIVRSNSIINIIPKVSKLNGLLGSLPYHIDLGISTNPPTYSFYKTVFNVFRSGTTSAFVLNVSGKLLTSVEDVVIPL